ncbi:MAG: GNAT family N-acetyltransferase [Thermoguttaceae bacterium]|jgi:predicted N-acetyltransferase YhbS
MTADAKAIVVDEARMPPDLDERIRAALCACFPADRAVFHRTRAWHGSPPQYSAVLEDAGRVIAHAGIVRRTITVGGAPLLVAGVQNVCVLPECRGQGLSDRVLQAAMDEARRRGFDCGLLFCVPALGPLYARGGWQGLGPREVVRVEEGREVPLSGENVAMFYPLRIAAFPGGPIHLCGNDW